MPAYVLIDADVHDSAAYETYKALGTKANAQYGGKFLARGGPVEVLEGDWHPSRCVVIEFPDVAAAKRWYASPEYAAARKARSGGVATFRAIVVAGV